MDFESPDVEREFPGLYASESGSGKRSQESDFSDDAHERSTKKDLLIGKRKDKKESKKDQGYAALEGESSPEEDIDIKSPCKSKKSKSFKFPTIKEKREKSREKDVREKDKDKDKEKDKDKDADREKDKKKESKSKLKLRDKKKTKTDDSTESVDAMPVFGVPLPVAVERSHCHDGVEIPLVVRDCIDHVQDFGLNFESIYKISGVKSKVQQLRRSYNRRELVKLSDYDVPTVTSLLKLFLRELPDSILTTELSSKFEDVSSVKELAAREQELLCLLTQLPSYNLTCLSWIIRHLENVAANESQNKMGINALATVLGPVLQTTTRVLSALLTHCNVLFPNIKLVRYVPPLSAGCTSVPSSREAITAELAKQDSLLNQIHSELSHGFTVRSDQLWEVQRFITLLKRKLRSLDKALEASTQSSEKVQVKSEPVTLVTNPSATKVVPVSPSGDKIDFQLQVAPEETCSKGGAASDAEDLSVKDNADQKHVSKDELDSCPQAELGGPVIANPEPSTPESTLAPPDSSSVQSQVDHVFQPECDEGARKSYLQLEYVELLKLQNYLVSRVSQEREEMESLYTELKSLVTVLPDTPNVLPAQKNSEMKVQLENSEISVEDSESENGKHQKEKKELCELNAQLLQDRSNLVKKIMMEREACINLKVQLKQVEQFLAEAKL